MNERDHMEVDPLGVCGRQLEALQKENRIQKWWSFFLFNLFKSRRKCCIISQHDCHPMTLLAFRKNYHCQVSAVMGATIGVCAVTATRSLLAVKVKVMLAIE